MAIFKRRKKGTPQKQATSVRSFAAAETTRLIQGWRVDCGFTPREISSQLGIIRGRSRQEAKDNPHMKKFLKLVSTNVVGQGFSFKSTPHDIQKGELVLDSQAARFIEFHWRTFCTHRDPLTTNTWFDLTGVKTAAGMDRLNAKTWARDGEYFIEIIYTADNPYGVTFRVIRPDACDHTYNIAKTSTGTYIECGVEKDKTTGRPVAYWFGTSSECASAWHMGKALMRIPTERIIHGFTQEDEGQPRGIPWAHASIVKMKMLAEYDTAELTAARDEACTVRTYSASDKAETEDLIDLTDPDNSEAAGVLMQEKNPGQAEVVPRGWEMKVHTPQHPNRELTAFKNSMLRDIATGFDVEYANFANDWAGVNFSSVRAGTISERDAWKDIQDDMISQCKQVQFLVWLRSFLMLSASGDLPVSKTQKFGEHTFTGRRWLWIDPVRDMNASLLARDQHWKTDTQITAESGGDYDANVQKAKQEADLREANGFPRVAQTTFAPVAQETETNEN